MALRPELRLAPEGATRWDWWPLARLLTVLAFFGALAHLRFGWTLDPAQVLTLPRRTFEVFSFFTLVSSGLAHLYLVALMFPLYAVVTLNDVFYDAGRAVFEALGVRSQQALNTLGLGGELLLFGVCFAAIRVLALQL